MAHIDEISRRIFAELGQLVSEAIGPDGKLSEAAQRIYRDVAGDASVFDV
ncbi:hypothetical protein OHA53_11075 [Streptomyces althioticus]|nr:hypothetical protein OHA53_11075 [Streptomyces althioticus]